MVYHGLCCLWLIINHDFSDFHHKVHGRDRLVVKYAAEQLGLEGSYIPRTYIEQIQLEKLVNEVMALPEDLKTKLCLDEDLNSSPADRIAWRNKNLKSGISRSYSNQREKNFSKFTGLDVSCCRYDDRNSELVATMADQGVITQLSEKISMLNDRMDEFTSRIEELSSKLTIKKTSSSQQNMVLQSEACNGSAPTSYFLSGLSNGSLRGSVLPNSSSSSQLMKEFPLMEEIQNIARGQRQLIHQLDNLNSLLKEKTGERTPQTSKDRKRSIVADVEPVKYPLVLALTLGALGVFLYSKSFLTR
ncbi:hypothetical protein Ancab_020969 [Ancistrocladus abbreviatus]